MAKKRKLVPAPVPEPEPESEPEEEEEEEEEDDPVEEEEEEEEDEDDEEEDSSDSEDENPKPNPIPNPKPSPNPNPNPNGSTAVDPTSVRDLLAPLHKDQLISLLTSAALSHPSVLKEIQDTADVDPSHRKLFVRGLSWDTTAASLYSFFAQYGTVEDVHNVTDKLTGKSKGYAFVLFTTRAAAQNALREPQKKIDSRMTSCQLASFGPPAPGSGSAVVSAASTVPVSEYTQRKIYVSNVAPEIDPGRLLEFFQQFGEIEEGPLGMDKATGKPKGFALFVYKMFESAKRALEQPHKSFGGHLLHCTRAIDGPKIGKVQMVQKNNHFGAGAASPAVAPSAQPAAHLMAPQAVPTSGVGYNQPLPQAMPMQATNAALGQAVGQALTALGLANLLGGLGGGVQAPVAANAAVPAVQGGYTAGMLVQGGYATGAPVQGGYAAGAPVQGGYAAGAPVQGGYAMGAPVQGGYATGASVQGGYAAGAPVQGGYAAGAPVQGGYANQGMGQGGAGSGYPQGGIGGYGIGGYGNHAPYR